MTPNSTDTARTRPIWQTRPCAPWCTSRHHDIDGRGSRHCLSEAESIGLKLMETLITKMDPDRGVFEAALDQLLITIEQDERESAPRFCLYRSNGNGFDMTIDEAQALVDHLTLLISTSDVSAEQ